VRDLDTLAVDEALERCELCARSAQPLKALLDLRS
jgi:hypothetical protein